MMLSHDLKLTRWLMPLILSSLAIIPISNLIGLSYGTPIFSDYIISVLGKYLCYAIAALAIDLIWGYCGILSLGQGLFFALGAYGMGMYLSLEASGQGVYQSHLPDFMVSLDWQELPWYWSVFESLYSSILLIILIPGSFAMIFSWLMFRSRVNGVYFSIITQASTWLFMLLFFRNELGFGGNNGLTDFETIAGFPIDHSETRSVLLLLTLMALFLSWQLLKKLCNLPIGPFLIAIRNQEQRLRMCGCQTVHLKVFVFTLAAVLTAISGALYVPFAGIINPSEMAPAQSIEMIIWVALGGRGTLTGPIIGAFSVNALKSWLTAAWPEIWMIILGLMFVTTTLFLPQGIIGLIQKAFNGSIQKRLIPRFIIESKSS